MFFSFELPPTLQQIMAVSESWTAWTKEIRRKRQKDTKTKSSIDVPRGWTLGLHNVFMYCSTGLKPIDLQSNIFATRWLCRVVSLASATTKAVSMEELIRESLLEFVREEVGCALVCLSSFHAKIIFLRATKFCQNGGQPTFLESASSSSAA